MGRPTIFGVAMTGAERVARHRAQKKLDPAWRVRQEAARIERERAKAQARAELAERQARDVRQAHTMAERAARQT